jgi:hypothetical protein
MVVDRTAHRRSACRICARWVRDLDCNRERCRIVEARTENCLIILDLMVSRTPGLKICKIPQKRSQMRQIQSELFLNGMDFGWPLKAYSR